MIKSVLMKTPMLDDTIWTSIPKDEMTWIEQNDQITFESIFGQHATDLKAQHNDPNLFPSKMSDDLLKKFPDAFVTSLEFDSFLRETNKFVDRLKKVGHLKEYTIFPGVVHGLGGSSDDDWVSKEHSKVYPVWIECYLRRNNGSK